MFNFLFLLLSTHTHTHIQTPLTHHAHTHTHTHNHACTHSPHPSTPPPPLQTHIQTCTCIIHAGVHKYVCVCVCVCDTACMCSRTVKIHSDMLLRLQCDKCDTWTMLKFGPIDFPKDLCSVDCLFFFLPQAALVRWPEPLSLCTSSPAIVLISKSSLMKPGFVNLHGKDHSLI